MATRKAETAAAPILELKTTTPRLSAASGLSFTARHQKPLWPPQQEGDEGEEHEGVAIRPEIDGQIGLQSDGNNSDEEAAKGRPRQGAHPADDGGDEGDQHHVHPHLVGNGAGLGDQTKPRRHTTPKTIPHAFGFRPGIDLDKLNQLVDDLEAEEYATRLVSGGTRGRDMILPDVNPAADGA